MQFLRSKERKTLLKIKTHLITKHAAGAGAGTVILISAVLLTCRSRSRYCFIFIVVVTILYIKPFPVTLHATGGGSVHFADLTAHQRPRQPLAVVSVKMASSSHADRQLKQLTHRDPSTTWSLRFIHDDLQTYSQRRQLVQLSVSISI